DVTDAATVLDGVLAGLAVAHAAGLVHRDISPANVLIAAHDGPLLASHVLLVDFGLADVTGRTAVGRDVLLAESVGDSVTDATATDIGVIGNAAFMSPEQAQGKPVRAAGDLYQAGALLYFLLTGRVPYPRDTTAQVLEAHVSAPPPVPSVLAPGARPLDRVVTRAMTKTPARRFRHAAEFRAAIAAAVEGVALAVSAPAAGEPPTTAPATRVLESTTAGQLAYLSPAPTASPASEPERSTPSGGGLAALVAVALIGGLAVWGVVSASASPEPATRKVAAAVNTPTPTATQPVPEAQPTASAPPLVDPVVVEAFVPTLYGTLADAERSLAALGLALGTVSSIESAEKAERVLSQNPQPGQSVPAGSAVDVTVASGTNTVPAVAQLSVGAARALLESAGFVVDVVGTVSPTATVNATQPAQGTVLRVGVGVVLLVDDVEPPVVPSPEPTAVTP
uniref:PASTA domain-containing protein n=1 Tax=Conyzicola sp. TaxID=1969404 RepID=UPI003989AD1F